MVRFGKYVLAAVAAAVLSLGNTVNAGVIYDNTSLTNSGYDAAMTDGPLYNSFSTGGTALLLTDIKLILSTTDRNSNQSFTVSLVNDNSNKPTGSSVLLATINDNSLTTSNNGTTVDVPVSSIPLAANTRYWIEVNAGGTSAVEWAYAPNLNGTNIVGEFWAYNPGGVLTVTQNSSNNTPFLAQVTASPISSVPEPDTLSLALSALGIGFVGMARRRVACS
jgi:uncharacterized membrane protein